MKISFSPQRRSGQLTIVKQGDALTINGETFDFTGLPDGATLPRAAVDCELLSGDVQRIDGEIRLTLILPHGPNPSQAVAFPEAITVMDDGPIGVPQ